MASDREKEPDFRGGRQRLELRIREQLTVDAYALKAYPVPRELQEKWCMRGRSTVLLIELTSSQREEFARDLAEWHARTGTQRYYEEILPSAKEKRGEAA